MVRWDFRRRRNRYFDGPDGYWSFFWASGTYWQRNDGTSANQCDAGEPQSGERNRRNHGQRYGDDQQPRRLESADLLTVSQWRSFWCLWDRNTQPCGPRGQFFMAL